MQMQAMQCKAKGGDFRPICAATAFKISPMATVKLFIQVCKLAIHFVKIP